MKYKFIFICLFLLLLWEAKAQGELNCNVTIDASQVEVSAENKALITEIKTAITNFLNTTKWTNDNYNPEERIICNLAISITEVQGLGNFNATAQIQSSRPVYGGSYETLLLNYVDKEFNFTYVPGMVLQFNENIYQSELTSLLGFYANVILGMDYDSFSKLGGTAFFEKVRNITNNIPDQKGGWKQLSDPNNRAGLTENLTNQLILPMREEMYTYHRLILDNFQKDRDANLNKMIDVLTVIREFNNSKRPNAVVVKTFFNAKTPELISMFSKATPEVKTKAVALLNEMDPTNAQKYQKILEAR